MSIHDHKKAPGNPANLTATRFQPGQSGNPGGRVADLPRFRAKCRDYAWAWLEQLKVQMEGQDVSIADRIQAIKMVADRGGFLPADRQAAVMSAQARLVIAMATVQTLTPAERKQLLDAMEQEFVLDAG